MNEYNLSQLLKELIDKNDSVIKIYCFCKKTPSTDFLKKFMHFNNDFFDKVEIPLSYTFEILLSMFIKTYYINESYNVNVQYIYHFFIMCENLFNSEQPEVNRYNEAKIRELKNQKIIEFSEINRKIENVSLINPNLLEYEYFNMKYKPNNYISTNIQNISTDNSVNIIDSLIENSDIRINSNITQNDLKEIVQAIQILISMNANVPQEFKNDLLNDVYDKNKLGETLEKFSNWLKINGVRVQINASVPILTNIAIQALFLLNCS